MKKLLEDAASCYRPKLRPSGHDISRRFTDNSGGAIPPRCQKSAIGNLKSEIKRSVARDIFAGSNTTVSAAEKLDRHWLAFEKDRTYLAASAFRFVDELPAEELATLWSRLRWDDLPVDVKRQQREMVLIEKAARYAAKAKRGDNQANGHFTTTPPFKWSKKHRTL
jgi:site-specific DNA-methyltransferase (cytosine-N4-specific)